MLWGERRLLARAAAAIGGSVRELLRPSTSPRSLGARLAITGVAIGLLGGGVPLVFVVTEVPLSRAGRVVAAPLDPLGTATVSVTLPSVALSVNREPSPTAMQKRHALIIGIDHAPGAVQLQGAVTDARNVDEALLEYGFRRENVNMLLNEQASRAAILSGLDRLADETPSDGIAVVAIAGHTRIRGGTDQFLAGDGVRINASELAVRMQRVRAPTWVALSTCFAEGYALPGVVGHNRIATFASNRYEPGYEIGNAGSYLIINMVRRAMIERDAPYSVESAFRWAQQYLERTAPNRVPLMDDGIDGDLVLGRMARPVAAAASDEHAKPDDRNDGGSQPQPQPTSRPGPRVPVEVCGRPSFNCGSA